ncbi:hypothetical protein M3Y97_00014600 [Aphelenchoides bicaudatus]|nr:hypothetical protein M3Y97_00014600 [Aphelenchoides bicaudatus]
MSSTQQITRFRWVIDKLTNKTLNDSPELYLNSEEFSLIKSRVKFNMKFVPNFAELDGNRKFCSLYINLVDSDEHNSLKITYSLWVENFEGTVKAKTQEAEAILTEENNEVGYATMVCHDVLCTSKNSSIPGHQITACCEIRSDDLFNEISGLKTVNEFRLKAWQVYQSAIDDGCKLKVGESEFNVSKTILIAQSRFFEQIFLLDEHRKNEYEFTNTRLEVIQALVNYIYLGKLADFMDFIEELYILSIDYKFHRLQSECADLMGSHIDATNAAIVLTMGFKHQDSKLKKYALEFAKREPAHHHLKPILKNDTWKKFVADNDELSNTVLDSIFDKSFIRSGADSVLQSVTRFKWTVKDFVNEASFARQNLTLLSDTFMLNKRDIRFHLKFEPTSRASFGTNCYSSLYIQFEGVNCDEKLHIGYRLWAENSIGVTCGEVEVSNYVLTNLISSIGHPKFVLQDKLYSTNFIKNGLVHFCCEIYVNDPLTDPLPALPFDERTRKVMFSLQQAHVNDNCTLIVDGHFKDYSCVAVRLLLQHYSTEGPQSQTLEIKDATPEAIEELVKYLYLEDDSDLKLHADELFKWSAKFGMHHLQNKCISLMRKTMDDSNVTLRLISAFKHKNPHLKKYAIEFIKQKPSSKHLKAVLTSQEWKQFAIKYEALSNEILNEILDEKDR